MASTSKHQTSDESSSEMSSQSNNEEVFEEGEFMKVLALDLKILLSLIETEKHIHRSTRYFVILLSKKNSRTLNLFFIFPGEKNLDVHMHKTKLAIRRNRRKRARDRAPEVSDSCQNFQCIRY